MRKHLTVKSLVLSVSMSQLKKRRRGLSVGSQLQNLKQSLFKETAVGLAFFGRVSVFL